MSEREVQIIQDYLDRDLFEITTWAPDQYLKERAYSRWACFDILLMVANQPFRPVDDVVLDYGLKMQTFCQMAQGNPVQEEIFGIALATAEDILTLLSIRS